MIMQRYCAEDVLELSFLLYVYAVLLTPHLAGQIAVETLGLIVLSQRPEYQQLHGR